MTQHAIINEQSFFGIARKVTDIRKNIKIKAVNCWQLTDFSYIEFYFRLRT